MEKHMGNVKRLIILLLTIVLWLAMISIQANAAPVFQDGVELTLSTNKSTYSKGEQVKASINLNNTNQFSLKNISLRSLTLEGYQIKESSSGALATKPLEPGKEVTLDVILSPIPITSTETRTSATDKTEDNANNATSNEDTQAAIDIESEMNVTGESSQTHESFSKDQSSTLTGETTSIGESSQTVEVLPTNESSSTNAKDSSGIPTGLLVTLIIIVIAVLLFLMRNRIKDLVSKIFLVLMFALSLALLTTAIVFAAEIRTISASTSVKLNNKDFDIKAVVQYEVEVQISTEYNKDPDFKDKLLIGTFDKFYYVDADGKFSITEGFTSNAKSYMGVQKAGIDGVYNIVLDKAKIASVLGANFAGDLKIELGGRYLLDGDLRDVFTDSGKYYILAAVQQGNNNWTTIAPSTIGVVYGSTDPHPAKVYLVR